MILQLTIWVEPGDPIFTSDMLLRALGFVLGIIASAVIAAIFRTMRSTAVRPAFLSAVLVVLAVVFVKEYRKNRKSARGQEAKELPAQEKDDTDDPEGLF